MKNKKPNAEYVWKQLEDYVAPRLRLSVIDRAVYAHLLRHSRLEGREWLRFSIAWLARGTGLSANAARRALRRLIGHGALRLLQRSETGHVVEVRLPEEILAIRHRRTRRGTRRLLRSKVFKDDGLKSKASRRAIHAREGGRCFYCLRRLTPMSRCVDHVVPRVSFGSNSYRNLVSCCLLCNSQKRDRPAGDFVRWLYRERRLTDSELAGRLRALDALAAGKLRPAIATPANPLPRKGRPTLNPANA